MAQSYEVSQILSSRTTAFISTSVTDQLITATNLLNSTTTPTGHQYTYPISETVIILIMMSILTVWCVLGNGLVIMAIVVVHKLKTPNNYLIVSLAVSDILVGVVVMPLAIVYEVLGVWPLGYTACTIWVTSDVTLSTSSILNLLMISVDRYLVITQPFKYSQRRTGKFMMLYITMAWTFSLLISTTPLIAGWLPDQGRQNNWCMVNQKLEYQMYATFIAFYIPLIIMIILYGRIFHITRRFLRAEAKNNPQPVNAEIENNEETHLSTNSSETSSERIPINNNNNSNQRKNVLATSAGPTQAVDQYLALPLDHSQAVNGHHHKRSPLLSNPHNSHLQPDNPVGDHRHGSGLKRFSVATIASIRKVLHRNSHKRNSQAVRTLGAIMGLFTACWLPFFTLAVIAPICGDRCEVPKVVWGIFTWLGYANSCFNPIIYAIFNREFRIPFKEILCCRCQKINEAIRHNDYMYQYGEDT